MAKDCISVVLLMAATLVGLGLFGVAKYGSTRAAIAAMRNEPLFAENAVRSFGNARVGVQTGVEFNLRNVGTRRIDLVGCRTSCDCVATSELPTSIEPLEMKRLRFDVTPQRATKSYRSEITILTNVSTQPEAVLSITGSVVDDRKD